ncbi:MAG: mobile mystery protein A [Bacteroidales bacterium]|nr:mobile mystery protein A [Bacteroidales bacterium]
MGNQRKLMIEQLDKKLLSFKNAGEINIPTKGWINGIRNTLNMTLDQFGKNLGITRQGARRIELSEASGTISVNLLKEAGKAMHMRFVYGFVPVYGSLEALIDQKANELAKRIVLRTNQTMMLEDQATGKEDIERAITELAGEFKKEMARSLWD